MTLNSDTDPNGVAVIIVGGVTPTLTALALVLGWTTELSSTVTVAVTSLINSGVALWAILRARRVAYAPSTVREQIERTVDAANVVRPDLPPPV